MVAHFEDPERGGFFFTSHDHERLFHRTKPGPDNATPSGTGVAAIALQRLSHLAGAPDYARAAERTLECFGGMLSQHPSGHASLLSALEEWIEPVRVTILCGPQEQLGEWVRDAAARFLPTMLTLALPNDTEGLPAFLRRPQGSVVTAYVCQGTACLPPITRRDELARMLRSEKSTALNRI